MNIIEVKDLSFSYDDKPTIDHISFSIPKGSYTSILGHNGSGKSTIAKLLIGLLEADSGSIIVDGITLSEETLYDVREKIGIVFQNPDNQFIGSTVRDDIAFGLENLCIDPSEMDSIINEYASKVHMEAFLDHEPTRLSGGQKQRVAIAGILAMNPELIIMDESTSMLDPRGRNNINQLVKELHEKRHMTIISITHDIEEAVHSDQVLLLNKGKIIKSGTPESVLKEKELLESLHLDVPFAYKISSHLKDIDTTISQEELVKQLCQLRSKM